MSQVLTPNEMYNLDHYLINDVGISEEKLMEGAALSCKHHIDRFIPRISRILIICGIGNNGGDGLALAKYLNNNHNVEIVISGNKSKLKNSTKSNYEILKKLNLTEKAIEDINFESYDVIIDSILGIGSDGNLRGNLNKIIKKVNSTSSIKIAIDLPTGLNPVNGIVQDNNCFNADCTITMYALKTGILLNNGKDFCGKVLVADLGITNRIIESYSEAMLFSEMGILKKSNNSSKFDYGKVIVIAGSTNMPGAACLTANSVISSGAGLVYLLAPKIASNLYSEIISISEGNYFDYIDNSSIYSYLEKVDSVVVGPGLGKSKTTEKLLNKVLNNYSDSNIIIDADALNYIDNNKKYSHNITITPHIVEFSRIINIEVDTILKDIPKYVKNSAKQMNLNIVLKGPTTVISNGEDVVYVTNGIPEMATAGSGDVLSGILGAYINFQMFDKYIENIANAVYIHNKASRIALESKTQLIASDIYKALQCIK